MSKQAVLLSATDLDIGEESEPLPCPFCQAPHEQKFSIKRTETGILYNCFRAKCGARGFIPNQLYGGYREIKPAKVKKSNMYKGELYSIGLVSEWFHKTWGLDPVGIFATADDEFLFPIEDYRGYNKGWVVRQPRFKGQDCPMVSSKSPDYPKALTRMDDDKYSRLSWTRGNEWSPHVVLVEDYLSALKITQNSTARGVALNGVYLGQKEIEELNTAGVRFVDIWLDPGATDAAYKLQFRLMFSFEELNVLTANKDPKDIDPEVIEALVGEYEYA